LVKKVINARDLKLNYTISLLFLLNFVNLWCELLDSGPWLV